MSRSPTYEELEKRIQELEKAASERKKTDEELVQLFSMSLDMICIADIETATFIKVNPAFTDILGYTEEELVGKPFSDFIHPDDIDATQAVVEERLRVGAKVINFENRYRCKDGSYRWLSWVSRSQPSIGRTYAIARDITNRKRMEEELESQNQIMTTLLDNLQVGVFMVAAPSGKPLLANKQAMKFLGRDIMNGADKSTLAEVYQAYKSGTGELYPAQEMPIVCGLMGESRTIDDIIVVHPDGTQVHLQVFGTPVRDARGNVTASLVSFADITEQKKAEEEHRKLRDQLFQSQKLESVGRLAGGVAHDFNNMLSIILGNVELMLGDITPRDSIFPNIEEIRKAAQRSADLTRQLLGFARKQTVAPRVLDLNATIDGMLKMFQRLIGEDIDLVWLPQEDLWPVRMDPAQVDQVLANLCVNARDAIQGIGNVTIETGNARFDGDDCHTHKDCKPGEYAMVVVSDSGIGIPKEMLDTIFEPFFTTKAIGKGTGLGLATVYGIVKQNKGFINVYSQMDRGTTFRIYPAQTHHAPAPCAEERDIGRGSGGQRNHIAGGG